MEAIVERIVEKCIQSELIEESQRDWMAYSLQRKFMNFGGFFILDSRLLWNTCCAVTASDSFEFWVGAFTGKDKWASYANSIFLLYHLFIL